MPKGKFSKLKDDEAFDAFFSDKSIKTVCSELGCCYETLVKRWGEMFSEEEQLKRKYRLRRNAANKVKPWEHVPAGEKHPMFGRSGNLNPNWKGDEHSFVSGKYRYVRTPSWWEGPTNAKGWVREHSVVWAEYNGKVRVPPGKEIHHIDGNGLNNDPKNLMLLSTAEHSRLHMETTPRDSLGRMVQQAAAAGSGTGG